MLKVKGISISLKFVFFSFLLFLSSKLLFIILFNVSKLVFDVKVLIGMLYKWGGMIIFGFDCSGFIWYVLNK